MDSVDDKCPTCGANNLQFAIVQYDDDEPEPDPFDEAVSHCGQGPDGLCGMAGSEYCEFDCPFSGDDV